MFVTLVPPHHSAFGLLHASNRWVITLSKHLNFTTVCWTVCNLPTSLCAFLVTLFFVRLFVPQLKILPAGFFSFCLSDINQILITLTSSFLSTVSRLYKKILHLTGSQVKMKCSIIERVFSSWKCFKFKLYAMFLHFGPHAQNWPFIPVWKLQYDDIILGVSHRSEGYGVNFLLSTQGQRSVCALANDLQNRSAWVHARLCRDASPQNAAPCALSRDQ